MGYAKGPERYRAYGKKGIFRWNGYYKILDDHGLVTYSRKMRHRRGGASINYFFSETLSDPVYILTRHELREVYGVNSKFIGKVLPIIESDYPSLGERDRDGRVLFNRLYNESI
jgi:hypothetical protein